MKYLKIFNILGLVLFSLWFGEIESFSKVPYPAIMLCSTDQVYPTATCQIRTSKNAGFKDCTDFLKVTVTVIEDTSTIEYCTVFGFSNARFYASDPYSIMTFTTNTTNLEVDHIALFNPERGSIPKVLDAYSDLIYVYRESALITITGSLVLGEETIFGNSLHSHARPNPPQYLWVKFDPFFMSA